MLRRLLLASAISTGDPYWNDTVSLLHFDKDLYWDTYVKAMLHFNGAHGATTFTESRFGTAVTRIGTPIISNVASRFGGTSLAITGDNNGVRLPQTTDWGLEEDCTYDGWIYLNSAVSGRNFQAIFGNRPTSGSGVGIFTLYAGIVSGEWKLGGEIYDGSGAFINFPRTKTITMDSWHHVAIERYNNVVTWYLDGENAGSVPYADTTVSNQFFHIGYMSTGADARRSLYGFIDEVRVTKGYARYKGEFTPPDHEFLQGERYFYDEKENTISWNGGAIITDTQAKFGQSGKFDGNDDWIFAASNARFGFGVQDFTVEAFVYRQNGDCAIWDNRLIGGSAMVGFINTIGNICFYDGSTKEGSGAVVALNTWTHVVWCRENGTMRMFVGGVKVYEAAYAADLGATRPLRIGADIVGGADLNGYIDEFRITKGVARYTSSFTPPNAPFPHKLTG